MANITTKVTSLASKPSRLRAMANNAVNNIETALERTADSVIKEAQENYDTAIPGPTYERTGNLGLEWHHTGASTDTLGRVRVGIFNFVREERPNGRAYSSLVQGDDQTQRHEAAGWKTIDEIIKNHSHEQSNRVRNAIRNA